jgi:IS30 family transposase
MREHCPFIKETEMQVHFAHPQCICARGTNENMNGLLRQLFPAGTEFHRVSRQKIKRVQAMLTDRPRKILNWHSPAHAFHQLLR